MFKQRVFAIFTVSFVAMLLTLSQLQALQSTTEHREETAVIYPASQQATMTYTVLIDDFTPQPLISETVWFYNRLGGDRGQLDGWWDPNCNCSQPGGGNG